MKNIIEWCNNNYGFVSAMLSITGLLLSSVAIFISVQTARLPFKKELKLTSFYDACFFKNVNNSISSKVISISVNAINTGRRNINLTFLGLAIKDSSLGNKPQKLAKINEEMTGIGIIAPTEIKSETYLKEDILFNLKSLSEDAEVYVLASDSEGKDYYKKIGKAKNVIKSISK